MSVEYFNVENDNSCPDGSFVATYSIKAENQGFGSFTCHTYLSEDDEYDSDDFLLNSFAIPFYPGGSGDIYKSGQICCEVPYNVTLGSKYIIFIIDLYDEYHEINEDDNIGITTLDIVDCVNVSEAVATTQKEEAVICEGEVYDFYGEVLTSSGTYETTQVNSTGCDYDIILTLDVIDSIEENISICYGETFEFEGVVYSEVGTYQVNVTNSNYCLDINLEILESSETTIQESICTGESYDFYGQILTASGDYFHTLEDGCSTIILKLTVTSPISNAGLIGYRYETSTTEPEMNPYTINGRRVYNNRIERVEANYQWQQKVIGGSWEDIPGATSSFYDPPVIDKNTCYRRGAKMDCQDEWLYSNEICFELTGCEEGPIYEAAEICHGETYGFGKYLLTTSGTYKALIKDEYGCENLVYLELTVHPEIIVKEEVTICYKEWYAFGDEKLTVSGKYEGVFEDVHGCDSTVYLYLTVLSEEESKCINITNEGEIFYKGELVQEVLEFDPDMIQEISPASGGMCGTIEYQWEYLTEEGWKEIEGATDNEYDPPVISRNTCYRRKARRDCQEEWLYTKEICFELIECEREVIYEVADICHGETYEFGKDLLTTSGTYKALIKDEYGCENLVYLELTVHPETITKEKVTICYKESYEFGEKQLTESGEYEGVFEDVNGCDSTVYIYLTVLSESESKCTNITDAGVIYYKGKPIEEGALEYDPSIIQEEQPASGGLCGNIEYQWEYLTEEGEWKEIAGAIDNEYDPPVIKANICFRRKARRDCQEEWLYTKEICFELIECEREVIYEVADICHGETYEFGKDLLTTSGTYKALIKDEYGCENLVYLELTVHPETITKEKVTICYKESYEFGEKQLTESGEYEGVFEDVHGCDSTVYLYLTVLSEEESKCINITNEGEIFYKGELVQEVLEFDPDMIQEISPASGGMCGTIEYQWEYLTEEGWKEIEGATDNEYDPPVIKANICFRRKARRDCQEEWLYTKEICFELNGCENFESGGMIGYAGELNITDEHIEAEVIFSILDPSGGGGSDGVQYQWEFSNNYENWLVINGANLPVYQPNTIKNDICYRRGARRDCDEEWVYSNLICFTFICNEIVDGGEIIFDESAIGIGTNNVVDPPLLEGEEFIDSHGQEAFYLWQHKIDGTDWININPSNIKDYDPSWIQQNTCFRRGTRIRCQEEWVYSTEVCFEVDTGCKNYGNAGQLSYIGETSFSVSFNPSIIDATFPTGGIGGYAEFQWQYSFDASNWIDVDDANAPSYDSPLINQDICYRRSVRRDCQGTWIFSDAICFTNCSENSNNLREEDQNCKALSKITIQSTIEHCDENGKGIILLSIDDSETYDIYWDDGSIGLVNDQLEIGHHCVTIIDKADRGCSLTKCFEIESLEGCYASTTLPSVIINEVSNVSNSGGEYIELLILGDDCTPVDLRGYIIDDNNGDFSKNPKRNIGISSGYIQFSNDDNWKSILPGSIILIYDPTNKNSAIKVEDDGKDSNSDKVYVLPINNNLLRSVKGSEYKAIQNKDARKAEIETSKWNSIWLYDNADAIQIRNPDGSYHYGISYGSSILMNGGPDDLHISPTNQKDKSISFMGDNPMNKDNFLIQENSETPGLANNSENLEFIQNQCIKQVSKKKERENSFLTDLVVYPNPFKNEFQVIFNTEIAGEYGLEIYDILGQRILLNTYNFIQGNNTIDIDLSQTVGSGSYFLIVSKDNTQLHQEKVICIQ